MRRWWNLFFNVAFGLIAFYWGAKVLPSAWERYSLQGRSAPVFSAVDTSGKVVELAQLPPSRLILVFWATWCAPCEIEINRLKAAVDKNELKPQGIYLVSMGEPRQKVDLKAKEMGYSFNQLHDESGKMAELFKVVGTPTIIFLDENRRIEWATMGLSPSLVYRAKGFLN